MTKVAVQLRPNLSATTDFLLQSFCLAQ
jgi:hypothetical protein